MAAGDAVQIGTPIELGMMGLTYANIFLVSATGPKREADVSEIKNATHGATAIVIMKNPRRTITITGLVPDASSNDAPYIALLAMKPGDEVLLNTGGTPASRSNEAWCVTEAPKMEHGEAQGDGIRVSITAVREDSMAATYGTT